MRKILFLGGSHGDITLIREASKNGLQVITTGNAPSDLGHEFADDYVPGDFSDRVEMAALARKLGCTYVCSSTNDFSEISASYIAEQMHFSGYDSLKTAESLHQKDSFRKICSEIGVSAPKSISVSLYGPRSSIDSDFSGLIFPVLIKPVDLSGGKGIRFCRSILELETALDDCFDSRSKQNRVVVEEFIEGSNHGATFIVAKGAILFEFFDSEHYGVNKFLVAGTSTYQSLNEDIKESVRINLWRLVSALDLKDGLVHIQYILSKNRVFFIEVTRRTPGDMYTRFVELATGYNYSGAILASKTGHTIEKHNSAKPHRHISRLSFHPPKNGEVHGYSLSEGAQNSLIEYFDLKKNSIQDFRQEKIGIGFFEFESEFQQREFVENFNELVTYKFID